MGRATPTNGASPTYQRRRIYLLPITIIAHARVAAAAVTHADDAHARPSRALRPLTQDPSPCSAWAEGRPREECSRCDQPDCALPDLPSRQRLPSKPPASVYVGETPGVRVCRRDPGGPGRGPACQRMGRMCTYLRPPHRMPPPVPWRQWAAPPTGMCAGRWPPNTPRRQGGQACHAAYGLCCAPARLARVHARSSHVCARLCVELPTYLHKEAAPRIGTYTDDGVG